jgi:hypothetical protein
MENDKVALNITPIIQELQNVPLILQKNELRSSKAVTVGEKLIALAKQGMTPELDKRMNDYLYNCSSAVKEMGTERRPLTAFLGSVTSMFTGCEKRISKGDNSIVDQVQVFRNEWATAESNRIDEEKRKAQRDLDIASERQSYVIDYRSAIKTNYNNFVAAQKIAITKLFESSTLENINETVVIIRKFNNKLTKELYLSDILKSISVKTVYLSDAETEKLQSEARAGNNLQAAFETEINKYKDDILELVPSKIKELEEIEKSRIKAAEAKKESDRLQAEANKSAEAAKKAAEAKAESDRLESKAKAEAAEAEKRKTEAAESEALKAKQQAEAENLKASTEKNVMQANLNFESEMQVSQVAAPKVKKDFEIIIKHQNGYQLIAAKFFEKQALNETIDALGRKTLDQMKSFCEKLAKEGEFIESKLIEYKEVIKAVNTKK